MALYLFFRINYINTSLGTNFFHNLCNFARKIAKIIAEIRNRTCIEDDAEVIKEILQGELNEYYDELNEYYEEEYYSAISSARTIAYEEGYALGYDDGYANGHSEV